MRPERRNPFMPGCMIVASEERPGSSPVQLPRPTPRDFVLARFLCREWLQTPERDHARLLNIAARYWSELTEAAQRDLPSFLLEPLERAAVLPRERLERYCEELVDHWQAQRAVGHSRHPAWDRDS